MIMLNKKILLSIFFLLFPALVWGQSARQLVAQGNASYKNGKFAESLKAYRQAAKVDPESPYVQFDLGNALYKTGDLQGALAAYEKAAANGRDAKFIGKSRFNQGNAAFKAANSKLKGDSKAALQGMNDSLRYYREAMSLDPKLTNAAINIEIVKQQIHKVKQQMARQQAKEKAARAAKKKMAKKLKNMAQKQQKMAAKSQSKAAKKKSAGNNQKDSKAGDDISAQQKLLKQTGDMSDKMAKEQKKQGGDKDLAKAQKAVDQALAQQKKSLDDLKKKAPAKAAEAQKQAAEKLKEAAESLKEHDKKKDKKKGDNSKAGTKSGKNKDNKGKKKSSSAKSGKSNKKAPQRQNAGKTGMQKGKQGNESAADLLNEERQNNIQRQQEQNQSRSGYEAVEKNW